MFVWRKGCLPWKERDIMFPLEMAEYYGPAFNMFFWFLLMPKMCAWAKMASSCEPYLQGSLPNTQSPEKQGLLGLIDTARGLFTSKCCFTFQNTRFVSSYSLIARGYVSCNMIRCNKKTYHCWGQQDPEYRTLWSSVDFLKLGFLQVLPMESMGRV